MKLLVYGSLRQYSNNNAAQALRQASEYKGEIRLSGFSLYNVGGWFPGILRDPDNTIGVVCELYEVKDLSVLQLLNDYEGYSPWNRKGSLFVRDVVTYSPGEEAFIYVFNQNTKGLEKIQSGDWQDAR